MEYHKIGGSTVNEMNTESFIDIYYSMTRFTKMYSKRVIPSWGHLWLRRCSNFSLYSSEIPWCYGHHSTHPSVLGRCGLLSVSAGSPGDSESCAWTGSLGRILHYVGSHWSHQRMSPDLWQQGYWKLTKDVELHLNLFLGFIQFYLWFFMFSFYLYLRMTFALVKLSQWL